MSIKNDLDEHLKAALRAADRVRLDAIRLIKTEASVAAAEPGFAGDPDGDEFYEKVISAFVKRMSKAKTEYEAYGKRGEEMAAKLGAEVDYLSTFLPDRAKDEDEDTAAYVHDAIAELGATDIKQAGQVIGHVMKQHRGLDGALVNRLVREAIGG